MKAINITTKKVEFEPIIIELTIESEEELKTLWHRLNSNNTDFLKDSNDIFGDGIQYDSHSTYNFFDIIDDITMDRGMQK